jgi:L-ascorbate peroxidase
VNELNKVLSSEDAPAALRLALNDAATYDAAARTGGANGSIVLPEELSRPENAGLKPVLAKIAAAKEAIDAGCAPGQQKLSWADALVLAVKVTQEMVWADSKRAKNPKNGDKLVAQFSNSIPVRLGRVDATTPDAAGLIPAGDAPATEVLAFMSRLGVKDPSALEGPFARKAPFWARPTFVLWTAAQPDPAASEAALVAGAPEEFGPWKAKYDQSRSTTFRVDYEIDFSNYFDLLTAQGANFDKNAYLYDITVQVPDRL